jgi:curved DNA-binding protein CbpA
MKTHYDVLGVPRNASIETIRTAFRKAAKRYHPDLNGGDSTGEAQLRLVLAAYDMLKKPGLRAAYDCYLSYRRRERIRTFAMTAGAGLGSGSIMVALMLALVNPQVASGSHPAPQVVVATANPTVPPRANPQETPVTTQVTIVAARDRGSSKVASKSDRADATVSAAVSPPARGNAPRPVQQAANSPRPAADHAKPRTRLTKEAKRMQASGDPKAALAYAARNRGASESEVARSKLIAVIDNAEDVALLNVLGLGDGAIAQRAQQRIDRLRAPAPNRQSMAMPHHDAANSLEKRAARFVTARLAAWASISAGSLGTFASAYADKVHYNGSQKSRKAIVLEKRRFLQRWPQRTYDVRPGSVTVHCVDIVCKITGMVDWQVRNAARAKSARGAARFEYEIAVSHGGFRIISESGSDVKHPQQADACPKPKTAGTAASKSHEFAARCLEIARTTHSAKRKSVLLARAQAWKRHAEAPERVELKFADRWPHEAALQQTQ